MVSVASVILGLTLLVAAASAQCGGGCQSNYNSCGASSNSCGRPTSTETFTTYCPEGWVRYSTTKCFKVFNDMKTQDEAEAVCNKYGSTLASLGSDDERVFVNSYVAKEIPSGLGNVWSGGKVIGGNWYWNDHSAFSYQAWWVKQPELTIGPCIQLATGESIRETNPDKYGTMAMQACATKQQYLCQQGQVPKSVTRTC